MDQKTESMNLSQANADKKSSDTPAGNQRKEKEEKVCPCLRCTKWLGMVDSTIRVLETLSLAIAQDCIANRK